jgi:hypothetical protein
VGLGGLEPPTSRLSSARSNQLSYRPEAHDLEDILSAKDLEDLQRPEALAHRKHRADRPLPTGQALSPGNQKEKRRRRRSACRGLTGLFCSKRDQDETKGLVKISTLERR